MIGAKKAALFLLIFAITFAVLFIPYFGFRSVYRNIFRASGMALFQNFGERGIVNIANQKKEISLLRICIGDKDMKENGVNKGACYDLDTYSAGSFLPAVFFISLVAAISISWKRKLVVLPVGFLLILFYAMLKLRITILYFFGLNPWIGLYQGAQQKASINFWYGQLALHQTPEFTFVLILWILLCIRKKEWQQLNGVFEKVVVNKKMKGRG